MTSAARLRRHDDEPIAQRVMVALAVSLTAHMAMFSVVQIGSELHWWDARPFSIFRKVRMTPEEAARLRELARQREAERQPPEQQTIFVQVTVPSEEPPEQTAFYSSQSSRAANPDPGNFNQVRLDGTQDRNLRLADAPRVATGRPSPPAEAESAGTADASPQIPASRALPPPEEIIRATETKLVKLEPTPERKRGLGELALPRTQVRPRPPDPEPEPEPKPEEKTVVQTPPPPVPKPTPPPDPKVVASVTPPPTPTPEPPTPAPRPRPRTLTEAKVRQSMLAGEKSRQDGGVARRGPVQLDVKGVPFGAYDEMLVAAVQNRWFSLLDEQRFVGGVQGHVVVTFKLGADGSVRIVEPTETTVDALFTGLCVRAISDPAPYEKWPSDMLRMVGKPLREMRFTFQYN